MMVLYGNFHRNNINIKLIILISLFSKNSYEDSEIKSNGKNVKIIKRLIKIIYI